MKTARSLAAARLFRSVARSGRRATIGAAFAGVVGGGAFGGVAHAGPHDFVIFAQGAGGTAADAKPYIDAFFKYLEKKLSWAPKSGEGEFYTDQKEVERYLAGKHPGYALVPPGYYLDLVCNKVGVTLLTSVVRDEGASTGKLHVVVKKGTAKNLEELKGKRLSSNHLDDERYLSRVAFDGKIEVGKYFALQPTPSPLKPLKALDRGEADAALIDDGQLAKMKTLPFGASLEVVYSSESLPPAPLIAFDKSAVPAERDALRKALVEMCGSKDGAETCKSMTIREFRKVDASAFQSAQLRYCKP